MKLATFLVPTLLCAAISFQALVVAARKDLSWSRSLFYAFLPACFLFAAGTAIRMSREVARLRRRIARLEAKAFPDGPPGRAALAGRSTEADPQDASLAGDTDPPIAPRRQDH